MLSRWLAGLALTCCLAFIPTVQAQRPASAAKQVIVEKPVLLRKGIQGFPKIQVSRNEAAVRINVDLTERNKKIVMAANDCDVDLAKYQQTMAQDVTATQNSGTSSWTRTVHVTMQGPRFISYVAKDEYFCGGVHPNEDGFALVYDLQSGELVDWAKLLPEQGVTTHVDTGDDGAEIQSQLSTGLAKIYMDRLLPTLDKDCADALISQDFASGFSIWPDARSGTLMLQPHLNHTLTACGTRIPLSMADQQGLGLVPEMVQAIQSAHGLKK